jgi:hypothetical protein
MVPFLCTVSSAPYVLPMAVFLHFVGIFVRSLYRGGDLD